MTLRLPGTPPAFTGPHKLRRLTMRLQALAMADGWMAPSDQKPPRKVTIRL